MARIILAWLFLAAAFAASDACAQGGWRGGGFSVGVGGGGGYYMYSQAYGPSPYRCHPHDYARAMYPKYYGGFHARSMQNIGIPPGDVGLRGNGVFMTPW